jgi:hypothetical protein
MKRPDLYRLDVARFKHPFDQLVQTMLAVVESWNQDITHNHRFATLS